MFEGGMMKPIKKWYGSWPHTCDICGSNLPDEKYFVDAPDNQGHWGLFCPGCHDIYCDGRLGIGLGQKYDSKTLEKVK
jgi:hypothetical protein